MNKMVASLFRVSAIGAAALIAQNAQSQIIYDNTTSSTGISLYSPSFSQAGNQVILAGPASYDVVNDFQFQFDLLNPAGTTAGTPAPGADLVDVNFYANDGATKVAGYSTPGTLLYSSGYVPLSVIPGFTGYTTGGTIDDSGLAVTVPKDFTWTVTFAELSGDQAGLALYDDATVGQNFGDAWLSTGPVGGPWSLQANYVNLDTGAVTPLEFGAQISGTPVTTPDSSSLWFSVMAVGAGFGLVKRSIRR
jgi:hypothetical protein